MVCHRRITVIIGLLLLAGCGTSPPAPVYDRNLGAAGSSRSLASLPEIYVVRRGDTLYSIAFRYNLDHRTLASWNAIGPPYTIYPDQVIWLRPRAAQTLLATARTTSPPAGNPATGKPAARQPGAVSSRPQANSSPAPATVKSAPAKAPAGARVAADIRWVWPVGGGHLNRQFMPGDSDRQGIDIGGKPGQPVVAAAAGEVVYSGAGFVGYAGLIIIKHNETLLSAYAHNRRRLVAEGDQVTAGQQIAEIGRSPRGVDEVYVQIRRNGEPQDPLNYLPGR